MPTTLTHTQDRTVEAGPLYRVLDTVTASSGIQPEVFVFLVVDDSFEHVATVDNMVNLENTKGAAITAGDDAYRGNVVQRDHESLQDAEEFGITLTERMQALVREYDAAITVFVGSDVAVVLSS